MSESNDSTDESTDIEFDSAYQAAEELFSRVESRRTFESLVNSMPLSLLIKDADGRRVFANKTYLRVRNTTMSELMGKVDADLFPSEIAEQYTTDDRAVMVSGKSLHSVEPTVDLEGNVRWIERIKSPIRDQDDNVTGLQLLFWDVTERIEARQQLDFERHLLRTLMRNLPDSIYFKDTDSRFIRISQAMAEKFGFSSDDDVVGKTDADIFSKEHAEGARRDEMHIIQTGEPLVDRVERETWPDQQDSWCISTKMPFLDDTGRVIGTFGISRDITDLIQSQDELRKARDVADKANDAKSEFLANMSHEIRTPMNAIIGMSELLTQTELTQEQLDYADLIRESAGSLLGLLNDILDFSKIEARKLELESAPFSLRDLVEKTGRTLSIRAAEKNLELACRVSPELPDGWLGDGGRLRQVLINLVANAIKFTEQGEVTIDVTSTHSDALCEQASDSPVHLRFAVQDTGMGIPLDKQAAVMEAFTQADASTTRKFGGTGLGLAISRQLVELMGGCLEICSVENLGTTFSFTIPVLAKPIAENENRKRLEKLRSMRVLVVDDNATNRRILDEILQSWNLSPVLADSGAAALECLATAKAQGNPFRFAILDCMMPEMDGFDLARRIRRQCCDDKIRLMILSSAKSPNDSHFCEELSIDRYMNKPVVQSDLMDALLQIMESKSERTGSPCEDDSIDCPPLRVLVAEDGLANQHVAMGLLKAAGHKPSLACDGKEAVERWQTGTYDLILMDMHMPEMDGLEATRAIRALEQDSDSHIPIIAVTAAATPQDARECRAAGMDDFLTKPIRPQILQETLAKHAPDIQSNSDFDDDSADAVNCDEDDSGETEERLFPSASDIADLESASFNISGGRDGMIRLARIFQDECVHIFDTMDRCAGTGDAKSLQRAAHTLKGSADLFNAARVVQLAAQLEELATCDDQESHASLIQSLKSETEKLNALLRSL
ncbi:response regulator [Planctomycetes bacterium K23_9]|uniref:Sensory/regulatory protein RpfC n=1 Tax=Stieleria marina TaxID=1930275 RepID=A0A517NT42_9BACT|nr:Signal transduction histidine-protein kinase BarA [Planctomycetes bacterium K23_9]